MWGALLAVDAQGAGASGGGVLGGLVAGGFMLVCLLVSLVVLAGVWKVFTKAGEPGWASLIPIYNVVVLLRIVGRPAWWTVLLFVPLIGFVVGFVALMDLARVFGRGIGYAVGLTVLPFIFFPHLGLGDSQYQGA